MAAKRQLLLELLATDKTGAATEGAAENLNTVADAAEEAAKATDHLGHQAEESTEGVDRFGKSNRTAAEHADVLKHEIESCKKELHELAVAFAEAQTAADRADLSKAIRKTQSDLRQLNKSKGLIEELVPSEAAVQKGIQKLGPTFTKQLKEMWAEAGEVAGPALGIAAVVAAPTIAAAISGAVIGGAGIGGIAGGLILASKNPQVSSALDALKTQTGARLEAAATPFVKVALDGIGEFDRALKGIDFEGLFSDAAKEAGPLIHGIAAAVEALGHGVTDLVHNAGPAVQAIGEGIGEVGQSIGNGLSELASNGQQGADALNSLFNSISEGTDDVFALVDVLTKLYGLLHNVDFGPVKTAIAPLTGLVGDVKGVNSALEGSTGTWHKVSSGISDVGGAAGAAATKVESFTDALDAAASAGQGLYGSQTNVAEALANLSKSMKDNGKTLDVNTEKGRNNRTALLNVASALTANYDAFVKVNQEGAASNELAGRQRSQFIKLAESFGYSKTQAEAFATQLGLLPNKKQIVVDAATAQAQAALKALKAKYDAFRNKTVTVDVVVAASVSNKVNNTLNRLDARADGGPVKKGHAYVVGERRPELFVPDRDGTIIPSVDRLGTRAAGSAASSSGTVAVPRLVIDFANADGAMATALIKLIRNNTGVRTTLSKLLAA